MATVVTRLKLVYPDSPAFFQDVNYLVKEIMEQREVSAIEAFLILEEWASPRWAAGGFMCYSHVNVAARWTEKPALTLMKPSEIPDDPTPPPYYKEGRDE